MSTFSSGMKPETIRPRRKDHAPGLARLERRLMLRQGLSLGALTLLDRVQPRRRRCR